MLLMVTGCTSTASTSNARDNIGRQQRVVRLMVQLMQLKVRRGVMVVVMRSAKVIGALVGGTRCGHLLLYALIGVMGRGSRCSRLMGRHN